VLWAGSPFQGTFFIKFSRISPFQHSVELTWIWNYKLLHYILFVVPKRADLRWKRQFEDLEELMCLQDELLDSASTLVKPGGILIYSTCSIDPEENEKRITTFIQRHPVLVHNNQHGFFSWSEVINSIFNLSYKNMSVLNIRRLLVLLSLCIVFPLK